MLHGASRDNSVDKDASKKQKFRKDMGSNGLWPPPVKLLSCCCLSSVPVVAFIAPKQVKWIAP